MHNCSLAADHSSAACSSPGASAAASRKTHDRSDARGSGYLHVFARRVKGDFRSKLGIIDPDLVEIDGVPDGGDLRKAHIRGRVNQSRVQVQPTSINYTSAGPCSDPWPYLGNLALNHQDRAVCDLSRRDRVNRNVANQYRICLCRKQGKRETNQYSETAKERLKVHWFDSSVALRVPAVGRVWLLRGPSGC